MFYIGITGHQNVSPDVGEYVRAELDALLTTHTEIVGISSLAEGADQIFAEAILAKGAALVVVVPADDYRDKFRTPFLARKFDLLLAKASKVIRLPYSLSSEEAYLAAGEEVVHLSDQIIAVWDGQSARGKGGTADVVKYARENNIAVVVIWPAGCQRN